jgi:Rieske Fe-S protein
MADEDRRKFLGVLTGVVGAAIGGAVAVPAIATLSHPIIKDTVRFDTAESVLGPVTRFLLNKPMKVAIRADRTDAWQTTRDVTVGSVWVIKTQEEPAQFRVVSTICPHLGCAVNTGDGGFHCPCHNSRFALTGARVEDDGPTNPSPRDLDALSHSVREGVLYCQYDRFKPGLPEQVTT